MLNQTSIVNMALGHICEERIEGVLTTEDSRLARLMLELWDQARHFCLASFGYPFSFSIAEVELTELTVDSRQWSHVYQLPAGILSILRLVDPADTPDIPFERLGQQIHTNIKPAWLRYIMDHDNPVQWPPWFDTLMSLKMASDAAVPITTDYKKKAYVDDLLSNALLLATRADERQSNKAMPDSSPYYDAHVGRVGNHDR